MTKEITITEAHLDEAIKSSADDLKKKGYRDTCHCIVAVSIAHGTGQQVVSMGYNSADLRNGKLVEWDSPVMDDIINPFDDKEYEIVRAQLPYTFTATIEDQWL